MATRVLPGGCYQTFVFNLFPLSSAVDLTALIIIEVMKIV